MNRFLAICLAVGLVLAIGTVALAGSAPGTGILQTSHDLSSATGVGDTWGAGVAADPTLDRVCIYCHAPHHAINGAQAGLSYYPLWNHTLSTIAQYDLYTNGTNSTNGPNAISHQFNGEDTILQPGSVSKLCLSCHDGSVAISAYGGSSNPQGPKAGGRILIGGGGDLKTHHPIGFDYADVAAKDDEIFPATNAFIGNNPSGLTINDVLWNNRMECSSCHDVHNTKNTGKKFLWVEDNHSNLCRSCHNK
jgi:predicted CXXCH cytochrome family protein